MIYLDNAATTIKKPDAVYDAVLDAMKHCGICGHPASDHKCGQFSANDFIALHYTESQSGKRRCDQILPDENVSHSGLPGRCLCRIFPGKCRESHSAGIFRRIWGTESIGAAADEASGRY